MSIAAATADAGQRAAETAHKSEDKPEIYKPVAPPTASDAQSSKSPLVIVFANRVAFALALTSLIYETCRKSTRRLLDGVAMPVPRRSTEPGAPDALVDFHTDVDVLVVLLALVFRRDDALASPKDEDDKASVQLLVPAPFFARS